MICKKCGAEFEKGKFCPECGTKYEEEECMTKETIKNKEKKKRKMPIWLKVVAGVFVVCVMLGLLVPSDDHDSHGTDNEYPSAPQSGNNGNLGILGTDCSINDLLADATGMELTFSGKYWTYTASEKYLLMYSETQEDGSKLKADFYVIDETGGDVLDFLREMSYEDEAVVTIKGVLDKVVIKDNIVGFEVIAKEAEILDPDSEEARRIRGGYFYVGDTMELMNGVTFTYLDSGTYFDELGRSFVYVDVEIDNQSEEIYSIYNSNVLFYGDDYALESTIPYGMDTGAFQTNNIPAGRKAQGRFFAECPDYNQYSTIEVEFTNIEGAVFIVKDNANSEVINELYQKTGNFLGMAGVYICTDVVEGGYIGKVEILEINDTEILFSLGTLDGPSVIMTGEAEIISECIAEYSGEGYSIIFIWNDAENMHITMDGTYTGMEAGPVEDITNNHSYVRPLEFNQ